MQTSTLCSTSTATILACQNIARSFKENIYELSRVRKEWDPEYATSLKVWIEDTIEKHYGESIDDFKEYGNNEWQEVMVAALQCLKVLRASIKVDFKNDKEFQKQFFKTHGYSDYFSDAKNGDHLSLYKFLMMFSENITEETKQKILSKGSAENIFEKIESYTNQIKEYKDSFEALETENELNSYGQKEVEEIYSTIKDICRIAIAYYQFDPIKRDNFNFYKVLRNL